MRLTMRTAWKTLAGAAIAAGAGLCAHPAAAHPHVWIYAYSDVVFDAEGRIVALNIEWEFDEFYSVVAVEGLDANGNGTYEPEEIQPVAAENVTALAEYSYFTKFEVNGAQAEFGEVTEYGSRFANGLYTLHMRLPLATPVDPAKQAVTYRMYDPSFYISIEYANAEAITAIGAMPEACGLLLVKSSAGQDASQTPEEIYQAYADASEVGALYADTVRLDCGVAQPPS